MMVPVLRPPTPTGETEMELLILASACPSSALAAIRGVSPSFQRSCNSAFRTESQFPKPNKQNLLLGFPFIWAPPCSFAITHPVRLERRWRSSAS